jgi:hypothetical protein
MLEGWCKHSNEPSAPARGTVSWLRWLYTSVPQRRPGLDPSDVNAGFVVEKMTPWRVFLWVLRLSPSSVITPTMYRLSIWQRHEIKHEYARLLSVNHRRRALHEDASAEDRQLQLQLQLQFARRLINVTCFYRPLSIGVTFFEMTGRKIWAGRRRLWSAFTAHWGHLCVVAFLSSGGPLLVSLILYWYWSSVVGPLTPCCLVIVATLVHTGCVFLLWSFLMTEIRPKLCSLLLGILCHTEPRAPWLLFTPASLGFDWGPLRSLVVVNTAMYVLNDDESSTEVI